MGRRKRKSSHCIVCETSYRISMSTILPCSTRNISSPHHICDSCLYRHVLTVLSTDITSSVVCPMQGCNAMISKDIITIILLKSNPNLSAEYLLKYGWRGTSEQWIQRFAALCPYCASPIEKNGGCNRVVCQRCRQAFDWQRAKDSNLYRMETRCKVWVTPVTAFAFRLLITILIILLMVGCLIYKEKSMSIADSSSTSFTSLFNLSSIFLFR